MTMGTQDTRGNSLRDKLVFSVALGGILASLILAFAITAIVQMIAPAADIVREMGLTSLIALTVGVPLSLAYGFSASKARKLQMQVQRLGQNDGLTSCFNEVAFSAMVDSYSNQTTARSGATHGTILLINVEDIETINDRFGYSWGNQALARTAEAIRKTIRAGDFVGRVSGTQFGVFLPGSEEKSARGVADRIYKNIQKIDFFPAGTQFPLSVRAGGIIVSDKTSFDELLRKARLILATTRKTEQHWIEYALLADWQPEVTDRPQ